MKLYGLAIAVAPTPASDNPNLMGIVCTPICVSDTNRDEFEILDGGRDKEGRLRPNLVYKAKFDSHNTAEVMECFVKTVEVLDRVVQLQQDSCFDHGIPYRPLVLEIGEDGRNPTNLNALYMQLFAQRFNPPVSDFDIKSDVFDKNALRVFFDNKSYGQLTDEQRAKLDIPTDKLLLKQFFQDPAKKRIERNNRFEAELAAVEQTRVGYLAEHQALPPAFAQACERLGVLFNQCSLREGSFSGPDGKGLDKETPLDTELARLKKDFESTDVQVKEKARSEIVFYAKKEGRKLADQANKNLSLFWFGPPYEYTEYLKRKDRTPETDKQMQDSLPPRFTFYHWDKQFKEAFHEAFQEDYWGPNNLRLKLPLDPPNPFFTDPVYYRLLDELEVVKQIEIEQGRRPYTTRGTRSEDGIEDRAAWRKKVMDDAVSSPASALKARG